MRIISGSKKGHSIYTFKSKFVRPLTDKNRETIFNILTHGKEIIFENHQIESATILDLFAGTGSFSFEALSRGASQAILVENDDSMIDLIKKNTEKLKFQDKVMILREDSCSLPHTKHKNNIDIVYCDPPYNKGLEQKAIKNLFKKNIINKNTLIILEQSRKSKKINILNLREIRNKVIGGAQFTFFKVETDLTL